MLVVALLAMLDATSAIVRQIHAMRVQTGESNRQQQKLCIGNMQQAELKRQVVCMYICAYVCMQQRRLQIIPAMYAKCAEWRGGVVDSHYAKLL